jgi:hypothetical protein
MKTAHLELALHRYNYREFEELYTMFVTDEMRGLPVTSKPLGALYKATWMATLLFSIKICLYKKQIQHTAGHMIPLYDAK